MVTTTGRQALPDQLRGLALLGIVLVNMPFLALTSAGFTEEHVRSRADAVTEFLVVALAQGKFYLLFSFLFGYGLTLLLRGRGPDGLRRYRRRLAGLAVLGLAHAALFFIGDILLSYAVLGLVLLLAVRWSDRTALVAAALAHLLGVALLALLVLDTVAAGTASGGDGFVADAATLDAALRGGFLDGAAGRWEALPSTLMALAVLNWGPALAMFLLGLVAGRRRLLAEPQAHGRLWRRLLVLAATVGLPAGLVSGWLWVSADPSSAEGRVREALAVAVGFGSAPLLTGGYVAAVALATNSRVVRAVAPAGRMSLTVYLAESVVLTAVFAGWGLGLLGRLGAFHAALVALATWLALEVAAKLWLARFGYGPMEWLLRCWTYGRLLPLRRPRDAGPAPGPPRSEPTASGAPRRGVPPG